MTTDRDGTEPPEPRDAGAEVRVFTCNRIGMRANPPSRGLNLAGRRRRS